MGKRTVKNYPSPRLMETIGATNQTTPEAIGELVANSFDARPDDQKMYIVIDMTGGKIAVIDNGKGMPDAILEKAVCIGEDMSQHLERGEGAKGHFGMGFKTSCSTLGGYYEIFTRPIGESTEYHVSFDIRDYSKRPSGADAWDVDIEDKPVDGTGPLGMADHGTAFVISNLKDKNVAVGAVLKYLGTAFKGHLKFGDTIVVVDANGPHKAEPEEYPFIKGTRILIDTACGNDGKYRITGWMALSEQTHNDGLYGFNIYRNNQLVEKWDKSWFTPHLMTSRIIGEVNLDFLDATFYKQGLQQSEIWKIVTAYMKEFLKPLAKASRDVSRKGNISKPAEVRRIVGDLRESYDEEPMPSSSEDAHEEGGAGKKGKKESINDKIKKVAKERSLDLSAFGDGEVKISCVEKAAGGAVRAPFDYIYQPSDEDDDPSELQVIIFRDHPLWEKKVDSEVVTILATSDAIYRMLIDELDFASSDALKIRNEWVAVRTNAQGE